MGIFLDVPLAAAVIVLSLWQVPESRNPQMKRLDWVGALLATASLGGLVTGLLESSKAGWGSPVVVGSLAGGAALLAVFLWVESRAA
jgi:hypothetical protein